MQSVKGKIALITGAAMGMGRLYAERAIAEGAAAVVLWDIDGPALAATRDDLRTPGTQVHAFVVDVSSLSDITTAAARVRAEVGDPDIVINNAGIVRSKPYAFARALGMRRTPSLRYQASMSAALTSDKGMLPKPGMMWLASRSR